MTRESIETTLAFARDHIDDDPVQLLLHRQRHPGIDMQLVAQQLEGHRQARAKWPALYADGRFLYPPRLNREQSSSQAAAQYKAALAASLTGGRPLRIADLTGGMGIDSMHFALSGAAVDYVEQNADLCTYAEYNFDAMGLDNLRCHCADGIQWLAGQPQPYDIIYVDPARRDSNGAKTVAFEQCTPNILGHLPLLLGHCRYLMVKASPMADIAGATRQLQHVSQVHVVAVGGECKELLFLCSTNTNQAEEPLIVCVDLDKDGHTLHRNQFSPQQEAAAVATYADSNVRQYLYEPHAALLKGGAYRSLCQWYGVYKLAPNTHLYTSDEMVGDFPGRIFRLLEELRLDTKSIKAALAKHGAGNSLHVISRNHPASAESILRQYRLHEGGELHLIATTLHHHPAAFLCRRVK